jgi:hypothetical protein
MHGPDDTLLAEDLRAIAPHPAPEFRARLDAQVAAGFPAPPHRRPWAALRTRLLVPALGAVAAAVVALVLVLPGNGSEPLTAVAPAERADSAAGSAAPVVPQTTPSPGRRVERSTRLELGAAAGRFTAVTDDVVRTTQRHGGFVAGSQIARDGRGGTATFVLRIPASRLEAAMADLTRLGSVRGIEQSSRDLTGSYDATSAKLQDARTQRRALVRALATASGREADRLRARLTAATARVQRLVREQRDLRTRTTYATVDLAVVAADRGAAVPAGGDAWTPGDAWRDARRALEVAAGVLIIAATVALPLAALALLGAWAARRCGAGGATPHSTSRCRRSSCSRRRSAAPRR